MKTEDGGKSWIACARTGKYWDEKEMRIIGLQGIIH